MTSKDDAVVSSHFARLAAEARRQLWSHMADRGLYERDGWRIVESVRSVQGGSELVLRPLHLHLTAPTDLECVVTIDEDTADVDAHCTP